VVGEAKVVCEKQLGRNRLISWEELNREMIFEINKKNIIKK